MWRKKPKAMSALWRKPLPSPIGKRDLFKLERFIGLRLERLALSAKPISTSIALRAVGKYED